MVAVATGRDPTANPAGLTGPCERADAIASGDTVEVLADLRGNRDGIHL